MSGSRRVRDRLIFLGVLLCTGSADLSSAHALPAVAGGTRAGAETGSERRFIPVAGLLIHAYSSDQAFGAGLQVGARYDFAALMFRESFLRSTQRAVDGALFRLKSRNSFELSVEAQTRLLDFKVYAGPGALVRRDRREWTRIEAERFVSRGESEIEARPFVVLGLIGSVVEANALLVLQSEPEFRASLGFVVGR
jgi:hypothetical protein